MINPDQNLLNQIINIARQAGAAILDIYEQDFEVEFKADTSPLTMADQAANQIILDELTRLTPEIPRLSEESTITDYEQRREWQEFWLIDPLDGTKEFVKRNGEFTVNIALISDSQPVLGVVYAPVPNIMYSAAKGVGAFKEEPGSPARSIQTRSYQGGPVELVASRSHAGESLIAGMQRIKESEGEVTIKSMGSSLKLCLVAEGVADVYPRLGPTSEWDTAAAHAIVNCAGGNVIDLQGKELQYNKSSILNSQFIVQGDVTFPWKKYFNG